MIASFNAVASIINEGTQKIERQVAKITKIAGIDGDEFIKTFPFLNSRLNTRILSQIKDEVPPQKKRSYLGIGFNAYRYHNYIQFYSTYKSFPLAKWDKIVFHFDDDVSMEFEFAYHNKTLGYLTSNTFAIKDDDIAFLAANPLLHWEMANKREGLSLIGGFANDDNNKQYSSLAEGQGLFKKMAEEILATKLQLY